MMPNKTIGSRQKMSSIVKGGISRKTIANIRNIVVRPIEIYRPAVAQAGLVDALPIRIGCQLDFWNA